MNVFLNYIQLNYLYQYSFNPDYSPRNLVVSKTKVKYQVKRIFKRCVRYFIFFQGNAFGKRRSRSNFEAFSQFSILSYMPYLDKHIIFNKIWFIFSLIHE
jgi:hypothetical protein